MAGVGTLPAQQGGVLMRDGHVVVRPDGAGRAAQRMPGFALVAFVYPIHFSFPSLCAGLFLGDGVQRVRDPIRHLLSRCLITSAAQTDLLWTKGVSR